MRLLLLCCLVVLCPAAQAAEVPPGDVLLKVELEQYGASGGLTPVAQPGASAGVGMALDADTVVSGALKLPAGKYTLLLRTFAPAGDQDGFFIEINGVRTRRVAEIGRWAVLALPFEVAAEGVIPIAVIGQEPGLIVDQIAVVRGSFGDNTVDLTKLADTASPKTRVGLEAVTRLVVPVRLRELQQAPWKPEKNTLFYSNLDAVPTGATGETKLSPGKWGQGLYVGVPDGRYDVDASKLLVGQAGTVEWWVRPRPGQRLWQDQGWHYFLHCKGKGAQDVTFDLSRQANTGLQLTASCGEVTERVRVTGAGADLEQWHHLLVSWDFRSDKQYLWLLFDGVGLGSFFPRTFSSSAFSSIEFGNTPSGSELPWLFMDGALDEVRISSTPVTDRLEVQP
ncbi:MAG: LamG-like jellyroll fold domain-containing protein [Armatimonadota bacterium]